MFHVELRQFPHNFCRFNLSEAELRAAVLDAWVRQQLLELGERRWDPRQASLTVIEGPKLSMQELSMGRGWRNAQRQGSDVTERVLALARAGRAKGVAGPAAGTPAGAGRSSGAVPDRDREPEVDPLLAGLLPLLGEDPVSLIRAWAVALERHPDRSPSQCLALAEDLVRR